MEQLTKTFLEIGFGTLAALVGLIWRVHQTRISGLEIRLREVEHEVIRLITLKDSSDS